MKKLLFFLFIGCLCSCAKDPIADFTFPNNQMEKSNVEFTNNSKDGTSYLWEFGDSITSTEESPSHAFNTEGTYTVTLTVYGEKVDATKSKEITILGVTADFSFSDNQLEKSDVVFTNLSENSATYLWDFGDGSTSTDESPTHAFDSAGTYTVSLTAYMENTEDVINKTITIVEPTANFTFVDNRLINESIVFTNTSENADSYLWDFGDGSTSTSESSTHNYTQKGTYTVSLTAYKGTADASVSKTIHIFGPVADFTFTNFQGIGADVVFSNKSKNADSYLWNFGDGGTSTELDPHHVFTEAGNFSVSLTAYLGSASETKTKTITIQGPIADFSFTDHQDAGTSVHFTNDSENSDTYSWDFGDGSTSSLESPNHTFSTQGTYTVTLTASKGANSDSKSKAVHIDPAPQKTTYSVKNSASFTLPALVSFYYNGSSLEEFTSHGNLSAGYETSKHETAKPNRHFGLTIGSNTCVSATPYTMIPGGHKTMTIYDNTQIKCSKSTGSSQQFQELMDEQAKSLNTNSKPLSSFFLE